MYNVEGPRNSSPWFVNYEGCVLQTTRGAVHQTVTCNHPVTCICGNPIVAQLVWILTNRERIITDVYTVSGQLKCFILRYVHFSSSVFYRSDKCIFNWKVNNGVRESPTRTMQYKSSWHALSNATVKCDLLKLIETYLCRVRWWLSWKVRQVLPMYYESSLNVNASYNELLLTRYRCFCRWTTRARRD